MYCMQENEGFLKRGVGVRECAEVDLGEYDWFGHTGCGALGALPVAPQL